MAGILSTILVLLLAVSLGLYQFYVSPFLVYLGVWRTIELAGTANCASIAELQACEKIVLHDATGVLYLACSNPEERSKWVPAINQFDESSKHNDYIATYDPATSKVTRLTLKDFNSHRGLSVFGMDVVSSASNPSELFVYVVNQRPPHDGVDPKISGADPAIEIFKTTISSDTLAHVTTVQHPAIATPNDVTGYPDGESFYFTNDHGFSKTGFVRLFKNMFSSISSVGFCHVRDGCSIVIPKFFGANGITKAPNGTIYVASPPGASVTIFERQEDNSLVLSDSISTEIPVDNLSIDTDGAVWAAGFPDSISFMKHTQNSLYPAPSRAVKITVNTGPGAFYGEKYKVEKAFENNGTFASGSTTVVHDAQRRRLFFHGVVAPSLTVCKV